MNKTYTIKKDIRTFYRAYIELMRPFLKGMRKREADVFSELLYQNYVKQDIKNSEDRFKVIFNSDNRKMMETNLNVSTDVFAVTLSSLKKKGLVEYNNTIKELFLIVPIDNQFSVSFNFEIQVDNG